MSDGWCVHGEGTVAILDMDVKMVRYIGGRVRRCACTGSVFVVEGRGAEGSSSPTRWSICHHKGQGWPPLERQPKSQGGLDMQIWSKCVACGRRFSN